MFVVDTNVLIYAADQDSEHHAICARKLQMWRRQSAPWYLTWSIVYEFLRVTTHPNVFRKSWSSHAAWGFLEAVMASPATTFLLPTERHADVLRETLGQLPRLRGNLLHDAHIAVLMREHGISRIVTRDGDFQRFPFLEAIDPLTA